MYSYTCTCGHSEDEHEAHYDDDEWIDRFYCAVADCSCPDFDPALYIEFIEPEAFDQYDE